MQLQAQKQADNKCLFEIVVKVAIQNVFCLEIYQNNIFF
jgi:hypothetical protein